MPQIARQSFKEFMTKQAVNHNVYAIELEQFLLYTFQAT